MMLISSSSTNWSRWRPRKDNRSWFFAGRMKRWDTHLGESIVSQGLLLFPSNMQNDSVLCELYQVTALRRQVRPVSGKVSRKVSLPDPLQEPSHRATPGRMHTSGASPSNGARCGITFLCVKVCISSFNSSKGATSFSSGVPQCEWEAPTSAG